MGSFAWLGERAASGWYWMSILAFIGFAALESRWPDRRSRAAPLPRWLAYMGIYAADLALCSVALPGLVFALVADRLHPDGQGLYTPLQHWGGGLAVLAAGLLSIDFLIYWLHRLQHRAGPLWRFHAVHHADQDMDVGTALLHHPVAYLLVAGVVGITLLSLGLPAWVFPVYGLFEVAGGAFQHVATPIPDRFERALRWVIVTPGLHQAHHSDDPRHHDTNYANVLSVWDRLFGTYLALDATERDAIRFGVRPGPALEGVIGILTYPARFRSIHSRPAEPVQQA